MGKPIAVFPADLEPELVPRILDEINQGRTGLDLLPESVPEKPKEEWYAPVAAYKALNEQPTRIIEFSGIISGESTTAS